MDETKGCEFAFDEELRIRAAAERRNGFDEVFSAVMVRRCFAEIDRLRERETTLVASRDAALAQVDLLKAAMGKLADDMEPIGHGLLAKEVRSRLASVLLAPSEALAKRDRETRKRELLAAAEAARTDPALGAAMQAAEDTAYGPERGVAAWLRARAEEG